MKKRVDEWLLWNLFSMINECAIDFAVDTHSGTSTPFTMTNFCVGNSLRDAGSRGDAQTIKLSHIICWHCQMSRRQTTSIGSVVCMGTILSIHARSVDWSVQFGRCREPSRCGVMLFRADESDSCAIIFHCQNSDLGIFVSQEKTTLLFFIIN